MADYLDADDEDGEYEEDQPIADDESFTVYTQGGDKSSSDGDEAMQPSTLSAQSRTTESVESLPLSSDYQALVQAYLKQARNNQQDPQVIQLSTSNHTENDRTEEEEQRMVQVRRIEREDYSSDDEEEKEAEYNHSHISIRQRPVFDILANMPRASFHPSLRGDPYTPRQMMATTSAATTPAASTQTDPTSSKPSPRKPHPPPPHQQHHHRPSSAASALITPRPPSSSGKHPYTVVAAQTFEFIPPLPSRPGCPRPNSSSSSQPNSARSRPRSARRPHPPPPPSFQGSSSSMYAAHAIQAISHLAAMPVPPPSSSSLIAPTAISSTPRRHVLAQRPSPRIQLSSQPPQPPLLPPSPRISIATPRESNMITFSNGEQIVALKKQLLVLQSQRVAAKAENARKRKLIVMLAKCAREMERVFIASAASSFAVVGSSSARRLRSQSVIPASPVPPPPPSSQGTISARRELADNVDFMRGEVELLSSQIRSLEQTRDRARMIDEECVSLRSQLDSLRSQATMNRNHSEMQIFTQGNLVVDDLRAALQDMQESLRTRTRDRIDVQERYQSLQEENERLEEEYANMQRELDEKVAQEVQDNMRHQPLLQLLPPSTSSSLVQQFTPHPPTMISIQQQPHPPPSSSRTSTIRPQPPAAFQRPSSVSAAHDRSTLAFAIAQLVASNA